MEETIKKPTFYNFIKRFLLHAVTLWLVINIWGWLEYLFKIKFDLPQSVDVNGSPLGFSDRFTNHNLNHTFILSVLLFALLAELNWVFVFNRQKLVRFVAGCVSLGIIGGAVSLLFTRKSIFFPVAAQFVGTTLLMMAYIAGYAILYNFFYDRYQRIKFYKQKSEAELQLLKAQINPHFFFNTLNNIYGIALKENASKTAGALELLSDMMRYNMDGVQEDFISLKTELKFIEDYLALQQLRIPANLKITTRINIEYPKINYKIAPMLLIPFVENAWKYGVSIDKPGTINLEIRVEKHQLIMIVENTVFADINIEKGSGLGIANVKQRLQMIYPGLHQLMIENENGRFRVKLSITV
ncbi:MAG: sensor histidine kinase [Mucilaginibacter sp.]